MAITDYSPRLRQWWINTRWPNAASGLGEVWAMNLLPEESAQTELPLFAAIDAYVLFGDPFAFPSYERRQELDFPGAEGFVRIGRCLTGCDALEVRIWARDNFDWLLVRQRIAAPVEITVTDLRLIASTSAPGRATLAATPAKAYALPFLLDSPALRALAASVRGALDGGSSSAAIPATMTIAWERAGTSGRTRPFDVSLVA